MLILVFAVPQLLGRVASLIAIPAMKLEMWIANSNAALPVYIRDRTALLEERDSLRQELANHASAQFEAEELKHENEQLRALLNSHETAHIAAAVVGRPTALPYDVFLIDKGAEDGIHINAPVFIDNDQAIGFIASVYPRAALVALATTPGLESTVYIYGPNIYTTAVGMGAGTLRVSVPHGVTLTVGDPVVLPSLARGLYGTISVVDSVPSRPEQYGYVSIGEPLASIRYVTVAPEAIPELTFEEAKEVVDLVREGLLTVPVPTGILIDVESTATTTATSTEATTTPSS